LIPREIDTLALKRHLAVHYAIVNARANYLPSPISTPISLFKATIRLNQESVEAEREDPTLGWRKVAGDNIRIIPIGGTHHSIMEPPHIDQLGKAINYSLLQLDLVATSPELSYSPRINIQSGNRNVAPLFCVPGAGASVTSFYDLTEALGTEIPIYGFQPRGLCGILVPHVDVPSAARAYIKAMREVAPNGPYNLIGHSFGGWVVYEMVCQLEEEGADIGTVVLLDSEAPSGTHQIGRPYSRVEILLRLVDLFDLNLTNPIDLSAADFDGLDEEAQINVLLARLISAKLLPPKTAPQIMRGIVRVFSMNINTLYKPAMAYQGSLQIVSIPGEEKNRRNNTQDILAMWRECAPKANFLMGHGNHITMLSEPNVNRLAAWLRTLFDHA